MCQPAGKHAHPLFEGALMAMDAAVDFAARISGATTDAAARVTGAIRDAAKVTGAGFEYLLNTAVRESNLDPAAKAKSSSATGLFQFIDQTWLGTMKQSGAALGYAKYANAITQTSSGRYTVADPAVRQEILALRKDPTANALMAGAFANANAKVLTERLGRKPTDGELYMAHFLGASGASRFISAAEAHPNAKAADLFPRAAQANNAIFYDKQGAAKSLKQVYAGLVGRHDVIGATRFAAAPSAPGTKTASTTVAAALPAAPIDTFRDVPSTTMVKTTSFTRPTTTPPAGGITAMAAIANATAAAAPASTRSPNEIVASAFANDVPPAPKFQSLFQSDENGPVGPMVRELWGTRRAAAAETATAITPAAGTDASTSAGSSLNAPLDQFQFLRPSSRRTS
jgi:hypothetical protein